MVLTNTVLLMSIMIAICNIFDFIKMKVSFSELIYKLLSVPDQQWCGLKINCDVTLGIFPCCLCLLLMDIVKITSFDTAIHLAYISCGWIKHNFWFHFCHTACCLFLLTLYKQVNYHVFFWNWQLVKLYELIVTFKWKSVNLHCLMVLWHWCCWYFNCLVDVCMFSPYFLYFFQHTVYLIAASIIFKLFLLM